MDEELGLRERKKRRTRKTILRAAIRLFDQKGYEHTTVSEIAAAAEVATKTFFNYFPTKEHLLFGDQRQRTEIMLEVVNGRGPGEPLVDLLDRIRARLLDLMASHALDWDTELLPMRMRLIMTVPTLQARALKSMFDIQRETAEALRKAYGDRLDPITAAAVVGTLVGAAQSSALASFELGESAEDRHQAAMLGVDVAMRGLRAVSDELDPPG